LEIRDSITNIAAEGKKVGSNSRSLGWFGPVPLIFLESLDFFHLLCHYMLTMQKIEKWRVQELAAVLHQLSELLRKGENTEWANVVFHFYQEAQNILVKEDFDFDMLKRLLVNIRNCYSGVTSFKNLSLWHENQDLNFVINKEFQEVRTRLFRIIQEIEVRSVEYIN